MSYAHAVLLASRCEVCAERPQLAVNEEGKKVCGQCMVAELTGVNR